MAEQRWGDQHLTMAERIGPMLAIFGAAFRASPSLTVLTVALRLSAVAGQPLFALLVARLADVAAGGSGSVGWLVVGFAVVTIAFSGLDELSWRVGQQLQERTGLTLEQEILGLVAGLPGVEHMERPDYLDRVDRLREDQWTLANSVQSTISYGSVLFAVASTVAVLGTVDLRLLILPVLALPSVWSSAKAERVRRKYLDEHSEDMRRWVDFVRLGTSRGAAKELRTFGLGAELVRRHDANVENVCGWVGESRRREAAWQVAGRLVFAVGYVGTLAWIARRVAAGDLPVSDLVLAVVLAGQVLQHVKALAGSASWLAWTLTAVRRWQWLVAYGKEQRASMGGGDTQPPPARLADGIRFEQVSFRYPATEAEVLRDVDLFLPAGSTVAVVGDNGAGKTTLVKLLCRFYEPTSGRITIDSVSLRDVDVDRWRTRVSAAFQDHASFELLVAENITLSDLSRFGDHEAAAVGLHRAGATDVMDGLPAGYGTQLGPSWPDGVDLSGGQWQKLALGRGMLRDMPLLLLLDEPTAALDAETEHRLFERYAERARRVAGEAGTITVLVSHRFSTVRAADLIVVVANGRVAEVGSHDELMTLGGTYAELFSMQARAYQ